jgi:hypothetical protein
MRVAGPAALALLVGVFVAAPGGADPGPVVWASAGPVGGVALPDRDLRDYRWNVTPRAVLGVEALVGYGRWGAGLRITRWGTSQGTGVPGQGALAVDVTVLQLLGQARLVEAVGFEFLGRGGVGRLHAAYDPAHLSFTPAGASEPVEVAFRPLDEWLVSGGVSVARRLGSGLGLQADLERSIFSLDTLHRNGDVIEESRETFGSWQLLLRLSWEWKRS